tara:strand:- start:131 stop:451 length:321 start_codon:yes stop_codon:yes gene_type:complete
MPTYKTNDADFDQDINSQKVPVVVDFGADWCGPCKQLDPILEEIAEENTDKFKVFKINIDENPMVPQKFGVRGIPTIMLFKDGKLIDTKVGSLPKTALENWIESNL